MTHVEIKQLVEAIMSETDESKKKEMIENLKNGPEFEAIQKFVDSVFNMVRTIWDGIQKVVNQVYKIVMAYRKASRQAFYKKKRTQRKNWKKWKKRKRG
ncbi:hypothetical protein CN385_05895 [Bacillus anthracis]|nr:hypothetical protein CN385_05895 [Bacillus anthracis]